MAAVLFDHSKIEHHSKTECHQLFKIWACLVIKPSLYIEDLNSKHLNNGNLLITTFYLSSIVFKWQSGIQTTIIIPVWNSKAFSTGPFGDRTTLNRLNTRLVRYSDPNCLSTSPFNMLFYCSFLIELKAKLKYEVHLNYSASNSPRWERP